MTYDSTFITVSRRGPMRVRISFKVGALRKTAIEDEL
jgi:hypothetical protein